MTATENILVLAVCCFVAYTLGKKGAKPCTCNGSTAAGETTDAPSSMEWFQTWAGLK